MLSAAEAAQLGLTAEEFAKLDADGDGGIDPDELAKIHEAKLHQNPLSEHPADAGDNESLLGADGAEGASAGSAL